MGWNCREGPGNAVEMLRGAEGSGWDSEGTQRILMRTQRESWGIQVEMQTRS